MGGARNAPASAQSLGQFSSGETAAVTAALARPEGLALDEEHGLLFVADTGNGVVRGVDQRTGLMTVLAGNPASTTPPSATPMPATAVSLLRPVGLAVDAAADEVFVSDRARRQILRVQRAADPDTIDVLVDAADLQRPAAVAFHAFGTGPRLLFALDRGGEGTGAGAVPRPRLRVIDVGTRAHTIIDPGFAFRIVYDLALRPLANGSIELLVAADVGENFEELMVPPPDIDTRFRFETDGYDGLDGDSDGLIDSLDPDFREPLKVQVLRFTIPAAGLAVTTGVPIALSPLRLLRCHKKFAVEILFDPGCAGGSPGSPSVLDLRDVIVEALAVDPAGRLYLVNATDGTVRYVTFDQSNAIVATDVVAGIDSSSAPPADGNDPRLTRLNRPLDVGIDALGNLYLADTVNNRVRRTWLGDILRTN